MKSILTIAFIALTSLTSMAQTVNLIATTPASGPAYSTEEIVLAAGDTATVLGQITTTSSSAIGVAFINGVEFELIPANRVTITGPATIKAKAPSTNITQASNKHLVSVAVTRANAVPSVTPQNAVVIPEDANGNFSVILESSTDLITWTAANPGTYSGTTQKRFFRTRIVKN